MKVVAAIITVSGPMPQCIRAIDGEGVPFIVNHRAPEPLFKNPMYNLYANCSRNRNEVRQRALETDADYVLFLDDDIVIPRGTVSQLLSHRLPVVCGWYPILTVDTGDKRARTVFYVGGRWVADNTFFSYTEVQKSVVKTDAVAMGCALVRRDVLEKIEFEAGINTFAVQANTQQQIVIGECGAFGSRCLDLGIQPYIDGSVVCEHLDRNFTSKV
jgi:hypothetical protein